MLQTLFVGAVIGVTLLLILAIFAVVSKLNNDLTKLMSAFNVLNAKVNRIEQISLATMTTSENFVDALRESNRELEMEMDEEPPLLSSNEDVSFDDLRESFENGIKKFEDDSDEDDAEPWKK